MAKHKGHIKYPRRVCYFLREIGGRVLACSCKDRERFGLEQCKLHELPVDD